MDDLIAVRRTVDRLLANDLGPLLDLLAKDVEFEVAMDDDGPALWTAWGPEAVEDYFVGLGGLVACWQMDYGTAPGQVIAWGKERFTVERCELEGACEFALVFELTDGMVTRLLMVEDLTAYVRDGGSLVAGESEFRGPAAIAV